MKRSIYSYVCSCFRKGKDQFCMILVLVVALTRDTLPKLVPLQRARRVS